LDPGKRKLEAGTLTNEGEAGCLGRFETVPKESVKVDQHCQEFFPLIKSGVIWFAISSDQTFKTGVARVILNGLGFSIALARRIGSAFTLLLRIARPKPNPFKQCGDPLLCRTLTPGLSQECQIRVRRFRVRSLEIQKHERPSRKLAVCGTACVGRLAEHGRRSKKASAAGSFG
jgi:hypothetical protein